MPLLRDVIVENDEAAAVRDVMGEGAAARRATGLTALALRPDL
jgi:hypothetical protein